jgi:hypothetical protein
MQCLCRKKTFEMEKQPMTEVEKTSVHIFVKEREQI